MNRVADGNVKVKAALGQMTAKLPAQADLDRLSGGAATLAERSGTFASGLEDLARGVGDLKSGADDLSAGAGKLAGGLDTLYDRLPAKTQEVEGDPAGLSASVQAVTERFAPVTNNGTGFAPYFLAMSLWIGCTMTSFIFPYQQLPESGRGTWQLGRVLRKAAVPALVVTAQALLTVWGVGLLGVEYLHPLEVTATAVLSSLTFLSVVMALIFCFGAAGRLFAIILLIMQLAASGGSFPVELTPPFFQEIHNFTPVTYAVNALRHAVSGAFEGQYLTMMARLALFLLVALGLALLGRRRWEFVPDADFEPLITAPR